MNIMTWLSVISHKNALNIKRAHDRGNSEKVLKANDDVLSFTK